MTKTHAQQTWYAGDSWEYYGNLTDDNGNALTQAQLTGATLEYKCAGANGVLAVTANASPFVTFDPVKSTYQVVIAKNLTVNVAGGFYTDQLRLTLPTGEEFVMWSGPVLVLTPL